MTDTTHTGPELPEPFGYVMEWPTPGGGASLIFSRTDAAGKAIGCIIRPVFVDYQMRAALTDRDAARKEADELRAERDAAFAMSRCECLSSEACANLMRANTERDEWIEKYKAQGQRADDRIGELMAERDRLRAELEALRAAAPVALTPEQIRDVLDAANVPCTPGGDESYDFEVWRACERAHGITAAQPEGEA